MSASMDVGDSNTAVGPHPECPVGHHPPQHPCEFPDCKCFGVGGPSLPRSRDALVQQTASDVAVQVLIEERDRLREALEGIAATEASMIYGGEKWVHWREQARKALDV